MLLRSDRTFNVPSNTMQWSEAVVIDVERSEKRCRPQIDIVKIDFG